MMSQESPEPRNEESTYRRRHTDAKKISTCLRSFKYLFLVVFFCGVLHSTYLIIKSRIVVPIKPRPRVFCVIKTYSGVHEYFGTVVKRTWARQCDHALFISNEGHWALEPLIFYDQTNWGAIKRGLNYVYRYHFDEADWFLLTSDDGFVILENLRKMLSQHSPDQPIYFGFKAKDEENQPYIMGPYVLSKEALHRFTTIALRNSSACQSDYGIPDQQMGHCLRDVGVVAGDSRDDRGRQRFIPFSPEDYLYGWTEEKQQWYELHSFYDVTDASKRQLPRDVIAFMKIAPTTMLTLHYMIYKLRIFGRIVPAKDRLAHNELVGKEEEEL